MKTLEYRDNALWLLDQTELPHRSISLKCRHYTEVAEAIQRLSIRGAPAIGLAAAYGAALAARELSVRGPSGDSFHAALDAALRELAATRPTAVNLFWAIHRIRLVIATMHDSGPDEIAAALLAEADLMMREDEAANRRMGVFGADLIPDGANVLTHCNAGALATGAYGTALGVIFAMHEQGKEVHVWVDETRPLLQGARLTTWELEQAGVPYTLITDNMAGHFMARGDIDLAIVGADRIAANGDTANKIGTYTVAVLARAHELPFYVAAPTSTVDLSTPTGREIPIEERKPGEVREFRGTPVAPLKARVANPAFDVTPARFIAGIVTERGVARLPFDADLAEMVRATGEERGVASAAEGKA